MKWEKQNGSIVELNDCKATVEKAVSLGWKPAEEKPKRVRKPKVKADANNSGASS